MGNCVSARSNKIVGKHSFSRRWGRGKGVWMGIENILGRDFQGISEFYTLGKVIGKGRFGLIREAVAKDTNKVFACKSMLKNNLETASAVTGVRREVGVMEHLKGHENVVDLEEVFEDKEYIHIVMELCTGGSLLESVTAVEHYSERDAANAIKNILEIVAHMHNRNIVHRDIKPHNFLLSEKGEGAKLKAIHFGYAAFYCGNESFDEFFGAAEYVAPEVLRGAYTSKADIWSCGVILFILLSGVSPFRGTSERDTHKRVRNGRPDYKGEAWRNMSSGAKRCLRRLLCRNQRRRPKAKSMLSDPWIVGQGTATFKPLHRKVFGRLKTFTGMNTLKKETLLLIAHNTEMTDITGLLKIFRKLDLNQDGLITVTELRAGVKRLRIALLDEELESIMDAVDVDQDGAINYEEFINSTIRLHQSKKDDTLNQTFKHFDADGDGYICKDELKEALRDRPDAGRVEDIIERLDEDKDGKINIAEYKAMMQDSDFEED